MAKPCGYGKEHYAKQEQAAQLRCNGFTWGTIAKQLGYANGETARIGLTNDAHWRQVWEAARADRLATLEALAQHTLAELLGKEYEPDTRQRSAASLLRHVTALTAQQINLTVSGPPQKEYVIAPPGGGQVIENEAEADDEPESESLPATSDNARYVAPTEP